MIFAKESQQKLKPKSFYSVLGGCFETGLCKLELRKQKSRCPPPKMVGDFHLSKDIQRGKDALNILGSTSRFWTPEEK